MVDLIRSSYYIHGPWVDEINIYGFGTIFLLFLLYTLVKEWEIYMYLHTKYQWDVPIPGRDKTTSSFEWRTAATLLFTHVAIANVPLAYNYFDATLILIPLLSSGRVECASPSHIDQYASNRCICKMRKADAERLGSCVCFPLLPFSCQIVVSGLCLIVFLIRLYLFCPRCVSWNVFLDVCECELFLRSARLRGSATGHPLYLKNSWS